MKELAIALYFSLEKFEKNKDTEWCWFLYYPLLLRASYSQEYESFPNISAGFNETKQNQGKKVVMLTSL